MKQVIYGLLIMVWGVGCQSSNPYHGLYNALFYDYEARLSTLEENLSLEQNREAILLGEYQSQREEFTLTEREKIRQEERLSSIEESIEEMQGVIDTIETNENYMEKLDRIRTLVMVMKKQVEVTDTQRLLLVKEKRAKRRLTVNVVEKREKSKAKKDCRPSLVKQRAQVNQNVNQVLVALESKKREEIIKSLLNTIKESKKYVDCANCKAYID